MACELVDLAPGLWLWRTEHPGWSPGGGWDPPVSSVCVQSGGDVILIDPLAPPPDAKPVWERIDAEPPTAIVILKPDHVRDVDLFARRYRARAWGPSLFWPGDVPRTELEPVEPGTGCPAVWSRSIGPDRAARAAVRACHRVPWRPRPRPRGLRARAGDLNSSRWRGFVASVDLWKAPRRTRPPVRPMSRPADRLAPASWAPARWPVVAVTRRSELAPSRGR